MTHQSQDRLHQEVGGFTKIFPFLSDRPRLPSYRKRRAAAVPSMHPERRIGQSCRRARGSDACSAPGIMA